MNLAPLIYPLWCISIAAQGAVIVRLLTSRLRSRYPFLFAYLAASVTKSLVLVRYRPDHPTYQNLWQLGEVLVMALYAAAALEAWKLTTERYPRLGSLGVNAFGVLLGVALAGSLIVAPLDLGASNLWPPVLAASFALRRFALFAVALFLLLAWVASDVILPISSRRNFTLHRRLLTLNAVALASHQVALNVFGKSVWFAAGLALLAVCSIGWFVWAWAVRPAGEAEPYVPNEAEGMEALTRMRDAAASIRRIRSAAK